MRAQPPWLPSTAAKKRSLSLRGHSASARQVSASLLDDLIYLFTVLHQRDRTAREDVYRRDEGEG